MVLLFKTTAMVGWMNTCVKTRNLEFKFGANQILYNIVKGCHCFKYMQEAA